MANCCRFYCCRLSVVGCCCFCFSVCVAVVVNVGMTNAFRFKRASGQTMGHHAELSIQNRPQVACCPRPAAAATKTTTTTTLSSSESCVHRCRCRCLSDNAPEEGGESSGGGWGGRDDRRCETSKSLFYFLKCRIWHFNFVVSIYFYLFFSSSFFFLTCPKSCDCTQSKFVEVFVRFVSIRFGFECASARARVRAINSWPVDAYLVKYQTVLR